VKVKREGSGEIRERERQGEGDLEFGCNNIKKEMDL
jgi:hypothetical protein